MVIERFAKEAVQMIKCLKKLSILLCVTMLMTMMFGMTVLADGTDTSTFDFGQTVMSVGQGESQTISLYAKGAYTYYIVGNTSKKTYCECSGNAGTSNITFHVGPDEKVGNTVTFWFYLEGTDHHDNVQVKVKASSVTGASAVVGAVNSANAQIIAPTVIPATAQTAILFPDGNSGVVSVTGNYIGLVSDAKNTPLGAFSVADKKGTMQQIVLQNIVSVNKISFIGVAGTVGAPNAVIAISAVDKASLMARGIAGLCLNGQYVLWP